MRVTVPAASRNEARDVLRRWARRTWVPLSRLFPTHVSSPGLQGVDLGDAMFEDVLAVEDSGVEGDVFPSSTAPWRVPAKQLLLRIYRRYYPLDYWTSWFRGCQDWRARRVAREQGQAPPPWHPRNDAEEDTTSTRADRSRILHCLAARGCRITWRDMVGSGW